MTDLKFFPMESGTKAENKGVFKHFRKKVGVNPIIVLSAFVLDFIVLEASIWVKWKVDMLIVLVSLLMIILIVIGDHFFLKNRNEVEWKH